MEESTEKKASEMQTVEEKVELIFKAMSDAMGVPVEMIASAEDNKVRPHFDMNAVLSKFTALMVYCGMSVPSSYAPAYNRVHADVEYWKKRLQETEKGTSA